MPPAQSPPRPAVGPQRFPVSSSCSSPSLSPHFLSLSKRIAPPLFGESNIIMAIRLPALAKYYYGKSVNTDTSLGAQLEVRDRGFRQ